MVIERSNSLTNDEDSSLISYDVIYIFEKIKLDITLIISKMPLDIYK